MIENGSFLPFSDIFGKAQILSVLPEFATSTRVFREEIRVSVKTLKKTGSFGLWPHRLLCFAGLRTQKRKSDLYCNPLYTCNNIDNNEIKG